MRAERKAENIPPKGSSKMHDFDYIIQTEEMTLPLIALKGAVAFPSIPLTFEISDPLCMSAAQEAFDSGHLVVLVSFKDTDTERISSRALYRVGTVAKITQTLKSSEGSLRVIAEPYSRAQIIKFRKFTHHYAADIICKTVNFDQNEQHSKMEALCNSLLTKASALAEMLPSESADMLKTAKKIKNPAMLADFISASILMSLEDKQKILEMFEPEERVMYLLLLLNIETESLELEMKIHKQVRMNMNQMQKEHYLREQMKVISEELGDGDDDAEYLGKIAELKCSEDIREKLTVELQKLKKLPYGSSESSVLRAHLDTCLDIPWQTTTEDTVDIKNARKILDSDHDGLDDVKNRIIEFLAVKQLNPSLKNQILCLVGAPGVGKTSVASSIARAMGREYVRVSLGGVRDEADIRGHRKTYVGSMPGRIVNALVQAKVKNPLMLLDEIDKLTRDSHGDPSSALLEVLDGEQNHAFRDHFVEYPVDLSECLFIATANTLDTVPKPLLDRMEVIELKSYTKAEKLSIAKNHLIPKQFKRHGITKKMLSVSSDAIGEIIDYYTREAGVRNLERKIGELARKAAKRIVDAKAEGEELGTLKITAKNVEDYLGARKIIPEKISDTDEIATVNGLAYTESGGDVLKVEVALLEGSGKLELTGSLGDVMKESARIAVSVARSLSEEYSVPSDFHKTHDIHIHFPEGAVPKDGPSAGVSILTALMSALTGRAVRRDIAMTGEISLRGRVLAIGGLREKSAAAFSYGVKEVLIPFDNIKDLCDVDTAVKDGLKFTPCKNVKDVLEIALTKKEQSKKESAKAKKKASERFTSPYQVEPIRAKEENI